MNKAIIFVDAKSDDNMETPISFIKVGGLGLLERQLRQLKLLGVSHVYLMSFAMPEKLHQLLPSFKFAPEKLEVVDANFTDTSFWDALGSALLVEEGCLMDKRIMEAVSGRGENNALALFDGGAVMYGLDEGVKVEVNGTSRVFASCAKVEGDVLKAASLQANYKSNPVRAILEGMLLVYSTVIVSVGKIDGYVPDKGRDVALLWRPISKRQECSSGTKLLMGMTQKANLNWPARFVHPVFENLFIYYALPTFISPNIIALVTILTGFYIAWLFAIGQMGIALAGAMVIGVFYGIKDKLAEVKLLPSKLSDLQHILDKIVEYLWFLAMAYYFANASGNGGLWAVGWLIILFSWANMRQREFFRCLTDQRLDDTGVFERMISLVSAHRNTLVWLLVPFAITQNWEMGLWVLAVYSAITFFVVQWRFIVRTKGYVTDVSEVMAENIKKTKCDL